MFPCNKCGLCCRHLDKSPVYDDLNRGDGVCVHFDMQRNLCGIYDARPLICRVDAFYEQHLSAFMSREDYIAANVESCRTMQSQLILSVKS